MKLRTWHQGMSDKETADLAYWERNMLALYFADPSKGDGWYYDDVSFEVAGRQVWEPRYEGLRRVFSLENGSITFHVPDDFDLGNLPQIDRNWDGHTTEEKWAKVAKKRGIVCEPHYVL